MSDIDVKWYDDGTIVVNGVRYVPEAELDRLREQYIILRDTFLSSNWCVQPVRAPKGFASVHEAIVRVRALEGSEQ